MLIRTRRSECNLVRFRRDNIFRFRRLLPVIDRVRRVEKGVGYYIPLQDDAVRLLKWSEPVIAQYMRKVFNVRCHLNTVEDFRGEVHKSISKIFTRYPLTKSQVEFDKICKTAIVNSIKDHMRKMFRKKRWGHEGSFNDNFVNPGINRLEDSHEASEGSEFEMGIHYNSNEIESQTKALLVAFKDQLSPESYKLLQIVLEDESTVCSKSKKISQKLGVPSIFCSAAMLCGFTDKISELYSELKDVACTLIQQGSIDVDSTRAMSFS